MNLGQHEHNDRPNGKSRAQPLLACPRCATALEVRLVEIEDEDAGTTDLLVLFDCPTGDYQGTLTRRDILEIVAEAVIRQLH